MKFNLAVVVILAFAAGLAAGLLGRNFISQAYAAEDEIIYVEGVDQNVGTQCDFNKTIYEGNLYTICVKK